MAGHGDQKLIVGLDIGTSKVAALVGEILADGTLEIIGIGSCSSRSIARGSAMDVESTARSVQRAVEDAEQMAGCKIHSVYAGISGSHVRRLNSHGIAAVRNKEVTQGDIDRVIAAARAVIVPADQQVLHVLPQEFIVDSQRGIRDPMDLSAVRMEVRVHMVTVAQSAAQNIVKCAEMCGLRVDDIVLEPIASARAVLTEDEKELGVCLVDIGAGTMDLAVFHDQSIRHTAVLPMAGDRVTDYIAGCLRTLPQQAEVIKVQYAYAQAQLADPDETIDVPQIGERRPQRLSRQVLSQLVESRYEELFTLIRDELRRSGWEDMMVAGVVLTGGASAMDGAVAVAEKVLDMPVRLGVPRGIKGLQEVTRNPMYATGVGLLLYGKESIRRNGQMRREFGVGRSSLRSGLKAWLQGRYGAANRVFLQSRE